MDEIQTDPVVNIDGNVIPRRMGRAELMGSRTHRTTNEVSVHIDQRDGKFLARGRCNKQAFGSRKRDWRKSKKSIATSDP